MKNALFIFFILCLFSTTLIAQKNNLSKDVFRISGDIDPQLSKLNFRITNGNNITKNYEIEVVDGHFSFKLDTLTEPKFAVLFAKGFIQTRLLVAPGYDLVINNKNRSKIKNSISGKGSEINQYYGLLDSIWKVNKQVAITDTMRPSSFNRAMSSKKNLSDSLLNEIFSKIKHKTNKQLWFYKAISIENAFARMCELTGYLISNVNKITPRESQVIYATNNNSSLLGTDPFKMKNYIYPSFYYFVNDGRGYLGYITNIKLRTGSGKNDAEYPFNIIDEIYNEQEIKDLALANQLHIRMSRIQDEEILIKELPLIETQLKKIKNKKEAGVLRIAIASIHKTFDAGRIGKEAPRFNLKSFDGKSFDLKDFRGKVIYLDFWASWCIPCRKETPALRVLYETYKNDNRIVFISIAVNDFDKNWREAIKQDKPSWLQLFDDGTAEQAYRANAIPRFVIIGKKGDIINFNAPRPSSGNEIEKLLLAEIKKN